MRLPVTPVALGLGIAGLIPFFGCGIGAVTAVEPDASRWMTALISYGAVILGFLGGVHWGFIFAPAEPMAVAGGSAPGDRPARAPLRLAFGVLPALIGWLSTILPAVIALAVLIAGFVTVVLAESRMHKAGLVPGDYMILRWGLTVVAVLLLAAVLVLHLLGGHVIL